MPTIQSAKVIAENALSTIGAFPASRSAPDPGEVKKALRWLEMLLSYKTAVLPIGAFWKIIEFDVEAGIGDYDLNDYVDGNGICHVFSVFTVDASGNTDPIDFEYESKAAGENLQQTGTPTRATVTQGNDMTLRVFPTPTQTNVDAGLKIRIRIHTFNPVIDESGTGDTDLLLRPSWYLWATKATAYEIGSGPVRRLSEGELKRLADDRDSLENSLLSRDGQQISPRPPVTDPVAMSVDGDFGSSGRRGYRVIR